MDRLEVNAAAAEEHQGHETRRRVEAVRTPGDGPDLAVERLGPAVGQAATNVGEDALEVSADGVRELAERLEPSFDRPGEPLVEFAASDVDLTAIEDPPERLLEQVGPEQPPVSPLKRRQLLDVEPLQVPRVLEQRPPGLLERLAIIGIVDLADLGAADLVESVVGEPLDVKAVEDDGCLGRPVLDGPEMRR